MKSRLLKRSDYILFAIDLEKRVCVVGAKITIIMKRKQLNSQGKEIVARVYQRMKFEALNGVSNLTDAKWRTAEACGVSKMTVARVRKAEKQGNKSDDPDKDKVFTDPIRGNRVRTKSSLDCIDVGLFRQTVLTYQAEPNKTPSLKQLKEVLAEKVKFKGCLSSMRTMLKEGFEWSDSSPGKRVLLEKHEIQMWKLKYLRQLKKYKEEGRNLVYTDEAYLNLNTKKIKRRRVISLHAGGYEGFIPKATMIFKPRLAGGDHRANITYEMYKTWFTTLLLPNLPENSVIIVDNAYYHNYQSEKPPNPEANKETMKTWLTKNNIQFEDSLTKVELYDLILKNKDIYVSYEIDKLAQAKGFEVLRLPPRHPELNPLKKIWDIIKEEVTDKNEELDLAFNIQLIKDEMKKIDSKTWEGVRRTVEHTEKFYEKYLEGDQDIPAFDYDSDRDGIDIKDEDMSGSSDDDMSE